MSHLGENSLRPLFLRQTEKLGTEREELYLGEKG